MIKWKLQQLLDEYAEKNNGHKLTVTMIHRDTQIARTTIHRMLSTDDPATRVDIDTMDKLISYLRQKLKRKITLDDLLPYNE